MTVLPPRRENDEDDRFGALLARDLARMTVLGRTTSVICEA